MFSVLIENYNKEAVSKVFFNHEVHKDFSQSSQRIELQHLKFVFFVLSLCSLWLKKTFETAPARETIYNSVDSGN